MSQSAIRPFHLALPVTDLDQTRRFYTELMRCPIGREASRWLDLDFFGHQVTLHRVDTIETSDGHNDVDADHVPARHFGVILKPSDWRELADRMVAAGVQFIIEPKIRFEGQVGEQATMFFRDPSGNALEFKSFANDADIFAVT
ncbi:MAG: VOC family protein [Pseudomonadota bacterium]